MKPGFGLTETTSTTPGLKRRVTDPPTTEYERNSDVAAGGGLLVGDGDELGELVGEVVGEGDDVGLGVVVGSGERGEDGSLGAGVSTSGVVGPSLGPSDPEPGTTGSDTGSAAAIGGNGSTTRLDTICTPATATPVTASVASTQPPTTKYDGRTNDLRDV